MRALTCDHLTYVYPGFELGPITIKVEPGITGLIGENGAGKTTLLAAIGGMLPNTSGTVTAGGSKLSEKQRRQRVAFASLRDSLYSNVSFSEHLQFLRSFYPDWSVKSERELVDRFDLPVAKRVGAASSGMRAKFWLVAALARRPDAILFDEPWNALDPASRLEFSRELRDASLNYEVPLVVSSHELEQLESVITSFLVIKDGNIVATGKALPPKASADSETASPLRKAYMEALS